MTELARHAAETLWTGLGRRDFLRAVAAVGAGTGVAGVAVDPRDTIADPSLFSHRRGAPTGRLASVIWMDPDGDAHGDDAPGERRPLGE